MRSDLTPEVRLFASEVFNRSWQFIEHDPVFAGEDRHSLQEQLTDLILALTRNGDRNLLAIANRAISMLREAYARQHARMPVEEFA
jgi:hypothetical protein